jgi:hypothetical protein
MVFSEHDAHSLNWSNGHALMHESFRERAASRIMGCAALAKQASGVQETGFQPVVRKMLTLGFDMLPNVDEAERLFPAGPMDFSRECFGGRYACAQALDAGLVGLRVP